MKIEEENTTIADDLVIAEGGVFHNLQEAIK